MPVALLPPETACAFDVVVVAASLGGLNALSRILADLPGDFAAPIVVAQHVCADRPSLLPYLLSRQTTLEVKQARDGEPLLPATVYTPPPGKHLLVRACREITVFSAPRIEFVRPCANLLFESAAEAFGSRVAALVLSGTGRDGARGVSAVRRRGGYVVTQDERTCESFDMPNAAIETRSVDLVLPLKHIGLALTVLASLIDARL